MQTGRLTVGQNDIHFIGRLSKLKDHWHRLYQFCDSPQSLQDYPENDVFRMKNYGINKIGEEPEYAKLMGLEEYSDGDVLPAYKVVADNYDLYSKIANYYKQDFICFGFQMDYKGFRDKIYLKWNLMMKRKGNNLFNAIIDRNH